MTMGFSRKQCPNCHFDVPGSHCVCHNCSTVIRKVDSRVPISRYLEKMMKEIGKKNVIEKRR